MNRPTLPHSSSSSIIHVHDLALPAEQSSGVEAALKQQAAVRLDLGVGDSSSILRLRIIRRALDARRPRRLMHVFSVAIELDDATAAQSLHDAGKARLQHPSPELRWRLCGPPPEKPPIVVGAGPAGLFAALTLAEAGWPAVVLERGHAVEERARDVSQLYAHGALNPDSNVCFGEGGAGTFSDGKLHTRIKDPRVERVLRVLVELGADPDIRIDARAHLGTDRLVSILRAMRQRLEAHGCSLRFATPLESLRAAGGCVDGVVLRDGEIVEGECVVLATGHSSGKPWQRAADAGALVEVRPFAVGLRIEHPQALIDDIRYGKHSGTTGPATTGLPAADYRLAFNQPHGDRRGVYSFCMCPGGVVVPTPTRQGELCINGMSHAARTGRFANSAIVVTVTPDDFARAGFHGLDAGVRFQRAAERRAFAAGGGGFRAPAARVPDFLRGRISTDLPRSSYRRGLTPARLDELYPAPIIEALRQALRQFDGRMRGFCSDEACLIGVETRTASPVRICRDDDCQARGLKGLYPAGEGAGYGGGIVSAAVDGIRAAEAILQRVGAVQETVAVEMG